MSPATAQCLMCQSPIGKKNSCRKYSLKLSGNTLEEFEGQDGFLCFSCKTKHVKQITGPYQKLNSPPQKRRCSFYTKPRRGKQIRYSVPNEKRNALKVVKSKTNLMNVIAVSLRSSNYSRAINALLTYSNTSRKAFCHVLQKAVMAEVKKCPSKTLLSQPLTPSNVANFDWGEAVHEAASHMPLLVSVLRGGIHRHQRVNVKKSKFIPEQRLGFILSLVMYSHQPFVYKFIQQCVAVKLKTNGCSLNLSDSLHTLGLCPNHQRSKMVMKKVTDFPQRHKQWQNTIQVQGKQRLIESEAAIEDNGTSSGDEVQTGVLKEAQPPVKPADTTDGDSSDMSVSSDNQSDAGDLPVAESAKAAVSVDGLPSTSNSEATSHGGKDQARKPHHLLPRLSRVPQTPDPGYAVVCNNVLIQSLKCERELKLQASAFVLRNRVEFDYEVEMDYKVKRAADIPLSSFLPNSDDLDGLKERMRFILERILKDHLRFLKDAECPAPEPHEHSEAVSLKSDIISLGLIDENPFSAKASGRILESLHQFVPSQDNENLYPIVCFGDGLSLLRMAEAKCAKASEASAADRLEGLVPCPHDSQRRGVLLQDTMDRFYSEESRTERGTLFQIKQDFGYDSVKVTENLSDAQNLMKFCAHALGVTLALTLGKVDESSKTPQDFHASKGDEQGEWLRQLSEKMVEFIWPGGYSQVHVMDRMTTFPPEKEVENIGDILDDMENHIHEGVEKCKCGQVKSEEMIRCFNYKCGWFHFSCASLEGPVEGDWWCSEKCQRSKTYRYCKCHRRTGKEADMIQCELQSDCTLHEWYHRECLKSSEDLPDKWYCSKKCEKLGLERSQIDGVQEYSMALLFESLCHLAFLDAVREGNGPDVISHWRINNLQFWNNSHHLFFILAHNMLAGVSGYYPARVAHDMTWNRVANTTGGLEGNMELDLVREIPSYVYWDNSPRSQDEESEEAPHEPTKPGEVFLRDLENIFLKQKTPPPSTEGQRKFDKDVQRFASEYLEDGLFDKVEGRYHESFPDFKHSVNLKSPNVLGKFLVRLSQCMDRWKGNKTS